MLLRGVVTSQGLPFVKKMGVLQDSEERAYQVEEAAQRSGARTEFSIFKDKSSQPGDCWVVSLSTWRYFAEVQRAVLLKSLRPYTSTGSVGRPYASTGRGGLSPGKLGGGHGDSSAGKDTSPHA